MRTLIDILILVLAFALGCAWTNYILRPSTNIEPRPIPLITGEDTASKFIVEKFEGVSVSLVTDKLTGCEYILTFIGGITPRMYSDGIQVCGQSTYPNGEHSVTTDADGFPSNEFSKNIPE